MKQPLSNKNEITSEKHLPHNFLAEKMILSCLLVNSEAIETTLQILPIEAFYFKNHQEIYLTMQTMHEKKTPIDVLTLLTVLQTSGKLERIGGIRVLIELISQVPNIVYLDEYIQLVKDKFIRRSLIKLGYQAINSSYITNLSLETIINDFESQLFDLTNEIQPKELLSSAELLKQIFFELKEKALKPNLYGLTSGFSELDELTQGFQNSDLIIIAGRPSMGKTAFGLNIALNTMRQSKLPVVFFSLEMSKLQIMYRVLAMEANINQTRLRSGKLYQNDWIKLNQVIRIVSRLPLFIDDTFDLTIQDIRSKIKTVLFEQGEIGLVIIDYLQLMQSSNNKNENRVQELSNITRSLKTIAREFDIPVIALSQLSRNVENRVDKKPILSDLRESGSIEQDADLVLMLYRNQYYLTNQTKNLENAVNPSSLQTTELILAKHRNGPIGTVQLKFDESRTKFFDINENEGNNII